MPLVTIHTSAKDQTESLKPYLNDLKLFIAKELSGESRNLGSHEISTRVIQSDYAEPISQIEVIITAFSYPERTQKQDQLCLNTKTYLQKNIPKYSFFVWLQLSELGHSINDD